MIKAVLLAKDKKMQKRPLKMLAISPPVFGLPLDQEYLKIHVENNSIHGEIETSDHSLLDSPSFQQPVLHDDSNHFSSTKDESKKAKKLNHNATERDRRKRINGLYSSLRSLLPSTDQAKKLSIPATVSRVLNYIPELQKELESLVEKKKGLLRRISDQENSCHFEEQRKVYAHCSLSAVSAIRLSEREIMIQISTTNSSRTFAEVLSHLEQDGLLLLNTSCFESFEERVFHNLHLQIQRTQVVDLERLKENLFSLSGKKQEEPVLLSDFASDK